MIGIDFSAARDAGRRAWVACGRADGGGLRVESCRPARSLPGSGRDLQSCLAGLRGFISESGACVIGLDFPFGLPAALIPDASWTDFISAFKERYPDSGSFQDACVTTADCELRRATDRQARTPLCPYNLRLYRQTYHGIADVLAPLVRDNAVRVAPMQRPDQSRPTLIEICPASLLKHESLYLRYKGRSPDCRAARGTILDALRRRGICSVHSEVRDVALDQSGGDALDSVLAACAVFRAIRDPEWPTPAPSDARYRIEGFVYT